MTTFVACFSYKGGSAKSTVSATLASALIAEGKTAVILDLDPQGSLVALGNDTECNMPDVYPDEDDLLNSSLVVWQKVKASFSEFDYVIVDHPPLTSGAKLTGRYDTVLLCTQPSRIDYLAALRGFKSLAAGTKTGLVISRVKNTNDQKEMVELLTTKFKDVFIVPESSAMQATLNRAETIFTTKDKYYNLKKLQAVFQSITKFI
jgi:chromosome partitioning protein